ncbi:pyridoxamine 5'-phosphate oxidase family protein [Fusicatenibacter sp.]
MREMRLKKREITDPEILKEVLEACEVVRIGTMDEEGMFLVPVNYGYEIQEENGFPRVCLYLHGAKEGRKAAAFAADSRVAVEMDYNHEVITGDYTCAYSYAYRSIMGNGTITEVTEPEAKIKGLEKIMAHLAPKARIAFLPEMVERVAVWRIDLDTFTGKERRRK